MPAIVDLRSWPPVPPDRIDEETIDILSNLLLPPSVYVPVAAHDGINREVFGYLLLIHEPARQLRGILQLLLI